MGKACEMAALVLVLAMTLSGFPMVFAQGPFEMTCPECNGSGNKTVTNTCTTCQGSGQVSSTTTCSICKGSGQTTVWQVCGTCYGSGETSPTITLKSMNGWETLVGLDWVARVQGVFHNEEDVGTYGVATSRVNTVTDTYYHSSARTYLSPHTDVTITIDTPEIEWLTDWTYSIYLSSKDDIVCPSCDGSGGESVIATCSACSGTGRTTSIQNCNTCNGSGKVASVQTCTRCNGRGYITNQSAMNLAIFGVAVVAIGIVLGAVMLVRSGRKKQTAPK